MMRHVATLVLAFVLSGAAMPAPALAGDGNNYNIMKPEPGHPEQLPEPWLPPKYKSPRGSRQHVVIPRPAPTPQVRRQVPPPILVPETGRVLPNLPTVAPSGPHGSETFQDRAARCTHQAGVYGQAAGDRSTYINSCINQ
jgi:hypothetical protein